MYAGVCDGLSLSRQPRPEPQRRHPPAGGSLLLLVARKSKAGMRRTSMARNLNVRSSRLWLRLQRCFVAAVVKYSELASWMLATSAGGKSRDTLMNARASA